MREFVGVLLATELLLPPTLRRQALPRPPNLKREALMFSRVAVSRMDRFFLFASRGGAGEGVKRLREELEWLLENDVIFDPETKHTGREVEDEEYVKALESEDSARKEAGGTIPAADEELKQRRLDFSTAIRQKDELALRLAEAVSAGLTAEIYRMRRECIGLRKMHNMDAYPVLSLRDFLTSNEKADKSDVVVIALASLPVPDESTAWEQIMEYRSDPDSQSKFLALRNWMSEVARAQLPPAEVEEKLEHLIDQYQKHMKLHRMKTNTHTLETIITTGAEVLGDLASFQWGKAAQALFSLKRREVALLEGEFTAPGNEVAYIVKARETFS